MLEYEQICENIFMAFRLVLCKHCVSGDVKDDVTKKQNSVIFCTEIVLKMHFFTQMLYLERNNSVLKAFYKTTTLSYKHNHWFGFDECTLNCISRFKQSIRL